MAQPDGRVGWKDTHWPRSKRTQPVTTLTLQRYG